MSKHTKGSLSYTGSPEEMAFQFDKLELLDFGWAPCDKEERFGHSLIVCGRLHELIDLLAVLLWAHWTSARLELPKKFHEELNGTWMHSGGLFSVNLEANPSGTALESFFSAYIYLAKDHRYEMALSNSHSAEMGRQRIISLMRYYSERKLMSQDND